MKRIFELVFILIVKITYALYKIEGVNACLLIAPAKLVPSILKNYGASIGSDVEIHSPLFIHNAQGSYRNLTIGNECYLGRCVFLDLKEPIVLEDRVTLSMQVSLITHLDVGRSRIKVYFPNSQAPIHIEHDSYIGAGTLILAGVTIGSCSAVGAGSVVLESVSDHKLYAGDPAREVRSLS